MNTTLDLIIGFTLGFSLYMLLHTKPENSSPIRFLLFLASTIGAGYAIALRAGVI